MDATISIPPSVVGTISVSDFSDSDFVGSSDSSSSDSEDSEEEEDEDPIDEFLDTDVELDLSPGQCWIQKVSDPAKKLRIDGRVTEDIPGNAIVRPSAAGGMIASSAGATTPVRQSLASSDFGSVLAGDAEEGGAEGGAASPTKAGGVSAPKAGKNGGPPKPKVWSHGTLIITPQKSLKSYRLLEVRHHMYHHNVFNTQAGCVAQKHVGRVTKSQPNFCGNVGRCSK